MPYYSLEKVNSKADGRWLEILASQTEKLNEAIRNPKKHVTCPIHGTSKKGKKGNGFRLFPDCASTGGGICNSCGPKRNGYELLQWVNGWNFKETIEAVAQYLMVEPEKTHQQKNTAQARTRFTGAKPSGSVSGAKSAGGQLPPKQQNVAHHSQQSLGNNALSMRKQSASSEPVVDPFFDQQAEPSATYPVADIQEVVCYPPSEQSETTNVVDFPGRPEPDPQWMEQVRAIQENQLKQNDADNKRYEGNIKQVWKESQPIFGYGHNPAIEYLKNRGILLRSHILSKGDHLRFHPKLKYYDGEGELLGEYPAIVAAIRNMDGTIQTLHRIYLTRTGKKARVACPKKMMSIPDDFSATGAAVQLGGLPSNGIIGAAEGIETALATMRATGIPCWSMISATILEKFEPPKGLRLVLIWADKDKSVTGENSANALKARLDEKGIPSIILMPKLPLVGKSVDWADVLLSQGLLGFPREVQLRRLINAALAE